jgi:hypothetical protein
MKTLIVAAIRCFLMFVVPTVTYAMSAQNNNAILIVESHTPGGPDQASTLLLPTLGLLGLVTYQRQLVRG